MKIIFLSIILHYSKHFKLNPKNSINEIKWLNIAKITKNITDFNKEYNTLYMHRRKNWECCVYFFLHNFAVCQRFVVCNIAGTRQTGALCRAKGLPCASFFSTRQTHIFAVCCAFAVCFLGGHMANRIIAVSWTFAVCCFFWHTAKVRFAVCLCFSTRQRLWHTAICEFPVVIRPTR